MAKCDFKFKIMIVKEYFEGSLGYKLLARKYDIPRSSSIKKWVNSYKSFGEEGLKGKPRQAKQEKARSREEQLERLRLEIAYLKKLKAFSRESG